MKEYIALEKRKDTHILKLKNKLDKADKREAELMGALEPFALMYCDVPCNCNNCKARDVIAKIT